MVQQATFVDRDEGEALWFYGTLILFKASSDTTGGAFSLAEQWGRKGVATPVHRHAADQETFIILDGELRFYVEGSEPNSASTGATVYIPPGARHAFEIVSETARLLVLTTPNLEAFFRAAGDPAAERVLPPEAPSDMSRVLAAAEQYGVEILGPPPGGH